MGAIDLFRKNVLGLSHMIWRWKNVRRSRARFKRVPTEWHPCANSYVANTQSLSQIIYKITNRDKYERKELRVGSEYEMDDDDDDGGNMAKEKRKKRNHRRRIE